MDLGLWKFRGYKGSEKEAQKEKVGEERRSVCTFFVLRVCLSASFLLV